MFWTLTTPVTVTVCGLIVCIVAATLLAPRFAVKRSKAFALSIVLGALAFIPSCMGINAAIAPFRFGVFQCDGYDDVNDWRVYRYLPQGATDITLEKPAHGNGFRAKFTMSQSELEAWIDKQWVLYGDQSEVSRAEANSLWGGFDRFMEEFSGFAEPLPTDAVQYGGPYAPNGAGFTIWYSPEQGVGYQRAGYW